MHRPEGMSEVAGTLQIPENLSVDQAASIPLALASVVTVFWSHDEAADGHTLNFPAPWEEGGLTAFAGLLGAVLTRYYVVLSSSCTSSQSYTMRILLTCSLCRPESCLFLVLALLDVVSIDISHFGPLLTCTRRTQ